MSNQKPRALHARPLEVFAGVTAILSLIVLVRLAVFMADPSKTGASVIPSSPWELEHSCLSAYFLAGQAAGEGHDPYDTNLYNAPDDTGTGLRKARRIGPFKVDVYEYPPPFLLLPRLCGRLTPDFLQLRPLWFGLNLALVLGALFVVARTLEPGAARRALLLSPLVVLAIATLSGLQKGNIQLAIIALSMLAMVLFERRHPAAGGALLAFTTASKLFPGLLVFYLLVRREWRAVAWTVAWGLVYCIATVVDIGWTPFHGFLEHLPGLLGGQAFPAFRFPPATAINFSVPGLVFKLQLFGMPGAGFGMARVVGTLCTLAVMAIIVDVARRPRNSGQPAFVWLSILILATLCSPFLPQAYAAYPPVWMLVMLAATAPPSGKMIAAVAAAYLGLNVYWPLDWPLNAKVLSLVILVPQAVTIAVAGLGLRHGAAMRARAPLPVPPDPVP